jgi:hypothetical protein
MNGQNVQGQAGGQNVQGQAAQNENPLLKFMTLLENEPNLSKQWMCKVCGLRFRGNCQRAYHHLLGDSQSALSHAFVHMNKKLKLLGLMKLTTLESN